MFWLHQPRLKLAKVAEFKKHRFANASLPGCTQVYLNSLGLAPFIERPCTSDETQRYKMEGWVVAVRRIAEEITATKNEEILGANKKPVSYEVL